MRNYTAEHNRRHQSKKRLAWEVDRYKWERMTPQEQQTFKDEVQNVITKYLNQIERIEEIKMTVENYSLKGKNGNHIRMATKVILDNGKEIKFMDKISKKLAIENANYQLEKHPEIWDN